MCTLCTNIYISFIYLYIYFGTYQFSWYTVGSHQHFTAILTNLPYQIKFVCICMCCCFMLFNKIPVKEGEFLNFDCSVHPSRREELSTFTGSFAKSHSLRRVPPPRGWLMIGALLKRNWLHKLNLIDTWTISPHYF